MKEHKVVEAYIRVEPSSGWWSRGDPEANLKAFLAAIRNHRDLDEYDARIVRLYEDRCSFCGLIWEVATEDETFDNGEHLWVGEPTCCARAQAEWSGEQMAEASDG